MFQNHIILSFFILSLILHPTTTTPIGFTYSPTATSTTSPPPPEHVVSTLQSLKISTVRLLNPNPSLIRAFSYSNISLLLTIPNSLITSLASNRSSATLWVYNNVLPFHPRSKIALISVGADVITSPTAAGGTFSDPSTSLLSAMKNLHHALLDLGIHTVSVSTTFSFITAVTTAFPPSSAEFQEPLGSLVIKPVLEFLEETNSSLLMNVYPYNVFRLHAAIPVGFALFQQSPFNFRDDYVTGVRYHNLFDMMVDSVIASMAVSGYENVPLIVAETGWPIDRSVNESEVYAEMYLQGLVMHLKSGLGTPLRKEGVAEAYIYQLFDDGDHDDSKNMNLSSTGTGQYNWGVMYSNLTLKYPNINFGNAPPKMVMSCSMIGVVGPLIHLVWVLVEFSKFVWIDN